MLNAARILFTFASIDSIFSLKICEPFSRYSSNFDDKISNLKISNFDYTKNLNKKRN